MTAIQSPDEMIKALISAAMRASILKPVFMVEDVMSMLDCSRDTVNEHAHELGGVKFGVSWIFPREAFLMRLNEHALASKERRKRREPTAVLVEQPKQKSRRRQPPRLEAVA